MLAWWFNPRHGHHHILRCSSSSEASITGSALALQQGPYKNQ